VLDPFLVIDPGNIFFKMSTKKHYTDSEKTFFVEILKRFGDIIENKRSDTTTLKNKEEAWREICDLYNASSIISVKVNMHLLLLIILIFLRLIYS